MKKRTLFCVLVFIDAAIGVGVYWFCHPTHFAYNNRIVIGSTADEITDKYGEFYSVSLDKNGNISKSVYMIRDNTPELVMSYDNSLWYDIYFADEIAIRVERREGYPGG